MIGTVWLGVILASNDRGEWSLGIGDPTFIGWFTVFAYLAALLYCVRAMRRARAEGPPARVLLLAWFALAGLMLALGINKQLDLQSWLTMVGREFAQRDGWYAERHEVQKVFIRAIILSGAAVLVLGAWLLRRHLRDMWLAGLGAVFITLFVMVRASSFHHVDIFLSHGPGGVRMNWVLELGGIACVLLGARRYWRKPTRRRGR